MTGSSTEAAGRWLHSGSEALARIVERIEAARESVRLEMYIFEPCTAADRIRDALVAAARRGLDVRVLVDAIGSFSLPGDYFRELVDEGGRWQAFNPLHPRRLSYRDHRKLLVCDRERAIVGGFNVAEEYDGDGVTRGWRDLGIELRGEIARALADAFDSMEALAGFRQLPFARLRPTTQRREISTPQGTLLLGGPGRSPNPIKRALARDLARADDVRIVSAYFLPTWRLRRRLMRVVRRGGRVRLILPAKSDVRLAQLAARHLYTRLLRAGIEIREYQPQVLHEKLVIIDDAIYAGSANFNTRSLHIDYELLVRIDDPGLVAKARVRFDEDTRLSEKIDARSWARNRGWWMRLQERVAYFVMARLDPMFARWLWPGLS